MTPADGWAAGWAGLGAWLQGLGGAAVSGARILMILALAWLAIGVAQRAIRGVRVRIAGRLSDPEAVRRAETLGRAGRYLAAVLISLLASLLVLSELGVSVAPLLGAAGVAGLAVGFGAQSLVKDYFTGLFLLLEDQLRQGDVVDLGQHAGLVEEVTLRYVRLRDYDGNVHFVPNGSIGSVINMGRGHSQAVIDVGVGYGTDLDQAMTLMHTTAAALRLDPAFAASIQADLEMAGVERWADSSVVIRARFKVAPLQQWTVRREYLRRLKQAFDAAGIEIPFPQLMLHRPARGAAAKRAEAPAPETAG